MGAIGQKIIQETKHSIWRTLSVLAVLLIFGGIGLGVYSLIGKSSQNIVAKKGSNVQITQINKSSRWFILFTELGVDNRDNNLGVYTRAGIRIEF